MARIALVASAAAPALAALLSCGLLAAQEPSPEEMQQAMARWQEAMTPGEHHQLLERFVGDWDITVSVSGMGPEAQTSTGTVTARWVLGGRFVREEIEGEMMGMPMRSIAFYGYDNFRRMYTLTEMDNLATATQVAQGSLNQAGDVITYFGTMDEPMTGERGKTAKFVMRLVGPDTRVFEIHDLHIIPGDTKVVEVTYRRRRG